VASSAVIRLDPERQARAHDLARRRRRLFFVELGLSALLLAAWLALGWSVALRGWLAARLPAEWTLIPAFGVIFFSSFQLLTWPLDFYGGFILPHRFGQSNQTLRGWLRDQALALLLSAALGLPLLQAAYWLLAHAGWAWWLWVAAGLTLFSLLLSFVGPVLLFPLFNKFSPLGTEHADLTERLQRLAGQAGARVSGVYRFDLSRRTKAANAALTGLGRTRRIILGDTLLAEFTPDEIETVIAHELGHHVHRDIPLGLAFGAVSTVAGLGLAALVLERGLVWIGLAGPADIASLPLLALALGVFGLLTLPLTNGFSRWREVRADEFALRITGRPADFANALLRLANQNLSEADPEPWVVWLFHSHPPIRERVARAEAWPAAAARPTTPAGTTA
jgi:STE24 endopeptidase